VPALRKVEKHLRETVRHDVEDVTLRVRRVAVVDECPRVKFDGSERL
jgi:hypothetical protein